jgi:hypothetical protein
VRSLAGQVKNNGNGKSNGMAIYHLSVKAISRSAGRTSTAAAAYRAGVEITDARTGEVHDYTRKRGVVSADLVLPEGAPEWAADRSALWNAAEKAERRKDACVAREYEVALPAELSAEGRRQLALDFAKEMADREGCAVDVAIHEPGREGDDRNHHAHILRTTRKVGPEGLSDKLDTEKAGRSRRDDLEGVRARWAELCNERLLDAGIEETVDHRSLKAQGIDREPTRHLGPTASAIERRTGDASRRRLDFDQAVTERLTRAKELGQLERERDTLQSSILDLSGDLTAAKIERDRMASEASKRAVEASQASMASRYVQALENVTIETLATVPGLLPVEVVRQAVKEIENEVQRDAQGAGIVDLDGTRRQVLAQPIYRQRLNQADYLEAQGKATLQDIASMGGLKKLMYDTKVMTQEANTQISQAKAERDQVLEAVERSPEMQAAQAVAAETARKRQQVGATIGELGKLVPRAERGQALFDRPEHIYRVPEAVGRVVDKARAIAPHGVKGMPTADIERLTIKALDVAWKAPEGQNEFQVRVSRFVVPAEQRRQLQENDQARNQDRGHSL